MAEPKLEIERRMEKIEQALATLARGLDVQTGFTHHYSEEVEGILGGKEILADAESGTGD